MFFRSRRTDYHQLILDKMKNSTYPCVEGGVCYGFAAMGLQAILLNDTETFNKRLDAFEKSTHPATISAINNKRLEDLSAQAFLDGVALYQNPHIYHQLFRQTARVNQNISQSSQLLAPQKLKSKGGIVETGHFCGVYNQRDLYKTLKSLRKQFIDNKISFPIGFMLCKHDHVLALGYDPQQAKWVLIEANLGRARWLNDHEAAVTIQRLFTKNETVTFDAKIMVAGVNLNTAYHVIEGWKLSATYLQYHLITSDTARMKDSDSATLLYIAAQNGRFHTVKELLDHGADINLSSRDVPSPLYIAAMNGHLDIVEELIKRGASVNNHYFTGISPLAAAAMSNHVDVAIALLDAGANFNDIVRNKNFLQMLRRELDNRLDIKIGKQFHARV